MPSAPLDLIKMEFQSLKFAADGTTYRAVLDALEDAIKAADQRLQKAKSYEEDHQQAVQDEELELVENLLGAAFVVCQTQITTITSRAMSLRGLVLKKAGGSFTAFNDDKKSVRKLGAPISSTMAVIAVEMLWALANYFKHHEEWDEEWKLDSESEDGEAMREWKGGHRDTLSAIKQAGLTPGSVGGNLRRGAEALGNSNYDQLSVFADAIDAWAALVIQKCEAEL